MRLAINYAINRQGIVDKILRGFGTPAGESARRAMPDTTPRYARATISTRPRR